MVEERLFAIAIAAMFGFLPFAVKDMPPVIAWIGVLGGLAIGVLSFAPIDSKIVWPISLMIAGTLCFVAGSTWLYQRENNENHERIFVPPELTPERLLSFFQDNTAIQATELTKDRI